MFCILQTSHFVSVNSFVYTGSDFFIGSCSFVLCSRRMEVFVIRNFLPVTIQDCEIGFFQKLQ